MNRPVPIPQHVHRRFRWLAALLLLLVAGCSDDIETPYGRRSAPDGPWSVNGTAVLAEMFEKAGHRVSSRTSLTPRLFEKADCIVWFPDSFDAPPPAVDRWLEDWLYDQSGRTLIYVDRDFDAAVHYWETILPAAPPEQTKEIKSRLSKARMTFQFLRATAPAEGTCSFFSIEGSPPLRPARSLDGDPRWLEDIDPAKTDMQLSGRLKPSWDTQTLLASGDDVLVTRESWYGSQAIVVANGSFLLNLPLVNHEHRKLAGRLIDQVGPPEQNVVFLESGPPGPQIRDEDPALQIPTGMDFFHEYPANWILLHMSIVGILFCFWRFPIFGTPFTPEAEGRSDFGRHIDALAGLLRRSQDQAYARARFHQYQQRRDDQRPPEDTADVGEPAEP